MKRIITCIIAATCIFACTQLPAPQQEENNQQQNNPQPQPQPEPDPKPDPEPARPTPDPVNYEEPFLVTSEIFMKFIQNVTYDERDYSYTHVMDPEYVEYGAPGKEDLPPTVHISWTAYEAEGELNLNVDDGVHPYDVDLEAGTQEYDISNLTPGRTVKYTVTRKDISAIVGHGSFKTTGLIHQLYFHTNVRNARDIGGWKTTDGKTVKYGMLFRGGDITSSRLSKRGIKEMRAQGVLAEIDLREAEDLESNKSRLGDDVSFFNANLKKAYGTMIRDYASKVAKTFQYTVKFLRENRPIYYHCSIGRDRTGTMTALYLGLLGVSESDISKEYELIYFSPADWSLNGGKTEFDYSRTKQWGLRYANDTMWQLGGQALGVEDTDYSVTFKQRIEAYLLANGVDQADIDDFRKIMLE